MPTLLPTENAEVRRRLADNAYLFGGLAAPEHGERLRELHGWGLVTKPVYCATIERWEYELTQTGKSHLLQSLGRIGRPE